MRIDHDRSPQGVPQQLVDQGDLGRSADQKHGGEILRGDAGGGQGPPERLHSGLHGRRDHLLERFPGHGHVPDRVGQRHRDLRLFAGGERLLRVHAVAVHGGQDRSGVGIVRVQRGDRTAQIAVDVVHDRLVEVGAAEPLDALGGTDDLQPVPAVAHHRAVEGATAQVVDGQQAVRGHRPGGAVVRGRGHRLGDGEYRRALWAGHGVQLGLRAGQAGQVRDGGELLTPVRAPHRGVGQHDPLGRATLRLGDGIQHGAEQGGHQRGGGEGRTREDHRGGITQAALEFPRRPAGVRQTEAVGRLTGQQRTTLVEVGDRRRHNRLPGQSYHIQGPG